MRMRYGSRLFTKNWAVQLGSVHPRCNLSKRLGIVEVNRLLAECADHGRSSRILKSRIVAQIRAVVPRMMTVHQATVLMTVAFRSDREGY